MVSIYQFATVGTFVQKIHASSFILMIIGFLLAVLFGPVFCGWVCPFGSIQEWFGGIGRKLFKRRRYNHFIPAKVDKYLRYLRYFVLIWVLYMTAVTGKLIFQEYDPYFALFNFWTSEVAVIGMVILGLSLLGSLFVERPWCKYACPYGAVLGITNLFRVFKIRRTAATCKLDGACDIYCPMNIPVSSLTVVRDHQCISCLECTSEARCPAAGRSNLSLEANNLMKLTAKVLAALIFVIIFGGIALTTALGWWQTTTTKIPVKFAEGEAAGEYNPADIRGSYKFGDISSLFEIPLAELQAGFHIPGDVDPAEYQVKSLEAQFAGHAQRNRDSLDPPVRGVLPGSAL